MKRFLCFLISGLIIFSTFTAVAEDDMASALSSVKSKVNIPETLTEFQSNSITSDGRAEYFFDWSSPDDAENITVTCLFDGTIIRYNYYSEALYKNDGKQLSSITREDAKKLGEDFVKQLIPEVFSENDFFVFDDMSVFFREVGTDYNLSFKRLVNGVPVEGEIITMDIKARGDKAYISNVASSFNQNIVFEPLEKEKLLTNEDELYKKAFPIQLTYMLNNYKDESYSLVYTIKDGHGYISALTGEKVKPADADLYFENDKNDAMADSVLGSAGGSAEFTPEELQELENMASLISVEDAVKFITDEKMFYIPENITVNYSSYSKVDDSYILEVELENEDYDHVSFAIDARTKELKRFSSYYYDEDSSKEDTLSEKELEEAETEIGKIVEKYANTTGLEKVPVSASERNANQTYIRLENSVPVSGNGIYVSYNSDIKKITSYHKVYTNKTFPSPEAVISEEVAYDKILEIAPVTLCYLKTDDTYTLCYKLDYDHSVIELNAITGKPFRNYNDNTLKIYNDIENHWCKDAVESLAQAGISLYTENFEPEKEITQLEMLRLFGGVMRYTSYLSMDVEDLYRLLKNEDIVKENERAENSSVLRENAFV